MGKIWFSASQGGFHHEGAAARLPQDIVLVAPETFTRLFAAQAEGQVIVAGPDGSPIAIEPPPLDSDTALAAIRAKRDRLLMRSDFTQQPDVPLTPAERKAWAAYRQALRDLPDTFTDPAVIEWPAIPA